MEKLNRVGSQSVQTVVGLYRAVIAAVQGNYAHGKYHNMHMYETHEIRPEEQSFNKNRGTLDDVSNGGDPPPVSFTTQPIIHG